MNFNRFLVLLFPIFFALPDLSIDTGVINLRVDDLIIYLFFILNSISIITFYKNFAYSKSYNNLLYLVVLSLISSFFTIILKKDDINTYEFVRSMGSIPYFVVLPFILTNPDLKKDLFKGVIIGGVIYLTFLLLNYQAILQTGDLEEMHNSAQLKKAVSFESLNPNAVATLAVILGAINLMGYIEMRRKYQLIISVLLILVPFFVFARGMSIGVIAATSIFIISFKTKNKKLVLLFIFLSIYYLFKSQILFNRFTESATNIDISTGEGFSGRFELWYQGFYIFMKSPVLGHGFSTENNMFIKYFDGQMAHQIFLHYLIELGVFSLILFLFLIFSIARSRYYFYKITLDNFYLIQLLIISAFFIADLSGQLLYFNKYAYLVFALSTFPKNLELKNV